MTEEISRLYEGRDDTSPAALIAKVRDYVAALPPESAAYLEATADLYARSMRAAFPTTAPELVAAIVLNCSGKLAGLAIGNPETGMPAFGLEPASAVMAACALRLWESK